MRKRMISLLVTLSMMLSLLPTVAFAAEEIANKSTANGQYNLSYYKGNNTIEPTVGGTDNAPVLTFERSETKSSGGVITSNYTMDFTRSFMIEGSVVAAERDGVSFALHTTKNKRALDASCNTAMLGSNLLNNWNKTGTSFIVTKQQNNIENGLLWDFMTYHESLADTRFYRGAYSYQIVDSTTVKALCDDDKVGDGKYGIKKHGTLDANGEFKLTWQCADASTATGNLTLTMGNANFTYTDLKAGDVFGGIDKAKGVYFSLSTCMPNFASGGFQGEHITQTKISIDRAFYTDTDDGSGKSTLGVEISYYIDTDDNGTYETQLKKATLVEPDQRVLCRNKIYNLNKNATSDMDMTLLIPNLSEMSSGGESKIETIGDQKFYTRAHAAKEETHDNSKMSTLGAGPLNSTAPLSNYVKVTLPAGGDGTKAYDDAYAVYEYTFTPGANVIALNQTIQLGVAPFTPAFLSSTVFFNSPEAFKPDSTAGKILFGTDSVGNNGLYRVVNKDNSSVTLFYNGADISAGGMAYGDANTWLNGDFWRTLTKQEQDALLPYEVHANDKVVLPSEDEVEDGGTWGLKNEARATADSGQTGTDWWLRTGVGDTAKAVTQNGTDIVDIATTQKNGIRPVMKLNLANVLFTKDSKVNLTNNASDTLSALSEAGKEIAPFRLTLLDTNRSFAVREDNRTMNVSAGDSITFHHTDATKGQNCYASAILTNSKGQDIYYGRLKAIKDDSDVSGTAMVTIPSSKLNNDTYTLKLFSETIHADKASDVASSLQSITCTMGNNLNGTVQVTGTAEYGCTLTATVTNSNYLGTLQYQWKRNGHDISGQTDSSYTLTADDIGMAVTCQVTDSGDSRRDSSISSTATTIAKRTLIAKSDNKQITTGQSLPQFTVTCSGFVNGDTAETVFADPLRALVAETVDGKTRGTFPIKVTAKLKASMDKLYQLSIQDGALTVSSSSSGNSHNYHTITATAGACGTISSNGSSSIREGLDKVYTFTPNKGYMVADVKVDGKSVGAVSSYTFTNVSSKHTLEVTYKLIGTPVNPQTGVAFYDVSKKDWFYNDVYAAVNKGFFAGTSETSFSPLASTTRGMIATVLYRMEKEPNVTEASIFSDTASDMYCINGIAWAQENKIIAGYGNGKYGPNDNITREQMAAILYRYAQFKGYDMSKTTSLDSFTDREKVANYAAPAMQWAVANGIISGNGAGILDSKGTATRAQVATILIRFNEKFGK